MSLIFLRPSRRLPWIVTTLLFLLGTGTTAYAFWASTTGSSNAAAAADALSPGSKPAVTAGNTGLTVAWTGGTTVNGRPATGYTVTRYSVATGGTGTPATGGCAGTVTTLSCTEQSVPGGIWYYTVTPAIALWTGAESPRSNGTSNDASAPVATVSGVSPTPNTAGWNNTSPVTVTITADDGTSGSGVASISYTVDGGAQQTVNAALATVPVSGDGTHTMSYFATDKVGNAGSALSQAVRIDTRAPAAPVPSVSGYVNSGNVAAFSVTGTAEAGATVTLTAADAGAAHSAAPVTATADGTGKWSGSLDLGSLNQGTITFTATATDAAGNTGASGTATSTKDTIAPAQAQSLKVPTFVNIASSSAVPVSGTAEVGATVTVAAASAGSPSPVTGSAVADGTGNWSLNIGLGSLKDGTVTYSATVKDAAGNTSAAVTVSDTKDTVPPVPTITAPMYVNNSTKGSVPVSGTTEAGTVVNVTVRDSALNTVTTPAPISPTGTSWSTSMDLSNLAEGSLTFTVATTDVAGNPGTASAASGTTKDTVVPAVTNVSLSGAGGKKSGTPDAGDTITITFSKRMDPAKSCSGWTGTSLNGTATLNNASTNDTMTFASTNCPVFVGTMSLGANYIASGNAEFGGNGNGNATTFTFDSTGQVLTIKLGALKNGGGTPIAASPGTATLSPATTLADVAGNTAGPGLSDWGTSGF